MAIGYITLCVVSFCAVLNRRVFYTDIVIYQIYRMLLERVCDINSSFSWHGFTDMIKLMILCRMKLLIHALASMVV